MAAHYCPTFVRTGGHRAVAEALNDGQCDALRRLVAQTSGVDVVCVPLYVFATVRGTDWQLTSLRSEAAFGDSAKSLITSRALREALLTHAGADLARAHDALARRSTHVPVVLRLVVVFADQSSHVNAVVVRGTSAELFEPKMRSRDTPTHPFGSVRTAVDALLKDHGAVLLRDVPSSLTLQTDDDLCQTWVAMFVVERLQRPTDSYEDVVRSLQTPSCDRLCRLLRFSEFVYFHVPFPRTSRRGARLETLSARRATTSRIFSADPGACSVHTVSAPAGRVAVSHKTGRF